MKNIWSFLGIVIFWLSWPLFWLYLPSTERTRILLLHGSKILVVKSWIGSGKWGLPGGGLHKDESVLDGALRELVEETGISIAERQFMVLPSDIYSDVGLHFVCHYFAATVPKVPTTRKQYIEIKELDWVERRKLNNRNAAADVLTALNAYDKMASRTESRYTSIR